MISEGYGDHRGRTGHDLVFYANGSTNPNVFFSLKPSLSQGESSKFQLTGVRRSGGVREQTNKKTDSLTDRQALL